MTSTEDIEKLERLLAEAVIGPWHWCIEDHSMATLSGPDELRNHVMSVSPCKNCMVEGESPIGKCTMPNQNTCGLIALLRNLAPSLIADWKAMRGEIERLTKELDKAHASWKPPSECNCHYYKHGQLTGGWFCPSHGQQSGSLKAKENK